ncbi:hypothetical protein DPMN_020096 [Dreissena polymorpha]|uniref:Uncharacterized protein n=1 Tax=Dreissena polymorpha TaxID=45954 RepID=A0A9D4MQ45_DREPO|nr:hypothetical protein DPMN_003665 [Dreissena polymorpha]KAH3895730.1 hypothetical protein DPMN_019895 [Dreissena polymorpha]KAH3895927.1 hypothetical protein DPMN_020096 [Dreissena polymorpha]
MRAFSGCDIWMQAHFFDESRKPPNVITRLHDAASIQEVTSSFIVGTSPVPYADVTCFRHYKLLDVNAVKNFDFVEAHARGAVARHGLRCYGRPRMRAECRSVQWASEVVPVGQL